jgi:DNA-binding IclR family transcriptional regulator
MKPNYIVPALARGLEVLELLSQNGRPATVAEITQELQLPRASVFRILYTLQHKGFVETDAAGKTYQVGPGILRLGYQYLATRNIVKVAQADIEQLARDTGVSAHLVVRDGTDIVYLFHAPGNSNFISNLGIGDRLPAHATPAGQLLLSQLSPDELSALYKGRSLETLTDQTPRSRRALTEVLEQALKRGYVISNGSVHAGGKSLAAPILDAAGKIVATIDISGPDQAFAGKDIETTYLPDVLKAASRISARLGYTQNLSRFSR